MEKGVAHLGKQWREQMGRAEEGGGGSSLQACPLLCRFEGGRG